MTTPAEGAVPFEREEGNEDLWRQIFADGHPVLAKKQRRYGLMPGSPRCQLCYAPFGGLGGWLMRRLSLAPSQRNPRFCNACDGFLKAFPGGAEVPLSMMFADIRNSVGLSRSMPPKEFGALVRSVREAVVGTLNATDGFVLEFQGDAIIGVWPPGFSGPDHADKAIRAANMLLSSAQIASVQGSAVPLGIGVHTGTVYLCTVAAANGRLQEIGAFGLDVNIAARLAASAQPGKAVVSAATFQAAGRPCAPETVQHLSLKGLDEPVPAVQLG